MIRSKGEAGTGDVSNAPPSTCAPSGEINRLKSMADDAELYVAAKELHGAVRPRRRDRAPGRLPVVMFTAGGIATPADAAMMMQLGADGVFVGLGHLQERQPPVERANAIVQATLRTTDDPAIVAKVSRGLARPMVGINVADLLVHHRLKTAAGDGRRPDAHVGVPPCRATSASTSGRWRARVAATRPRARWSPPEGIDALVVPGGESTTMSNLALRWGLMEPLHAVSVAPDAPAYGSCAG